MKKYLLSIEMNGHRSNGFLLLTVVIETAILSEMELANYFQRMEFFVRVGSLAAAACHGLKLPL